MKEKELDLDFTHLLNLALALWLGYLLALAIIDRLFYARPVFPPGYYLANGGDMLAVWGLVLAMRRNPRWRKMALPLVIVLLSVPPVVLAQVMTMRLPRLPSNGPEAILLRTMPLLLMALILTAWQYGWRYVQLFSGGIALFVLMVNLAFYRPGGASLAPPLTILLIQTISFVVVGYFVSSLIKRLEQQRAALACANAQLTDYAGTLENLTISRERNRLARELHDTLAHTLSALSVQLETAKAYWEVDSQTAQRLLEQSLVTTRSGLQETRRALKSLRAAPLDDLGVLLALRQLAGELAARANVPLTLTLPAQLPALPAAVEQALYRIAQEALTNVAHHANAHTLAVALALDGRELSLRVQDDGIGFAAEAEPAAGHFGLPGMRERAQLVGGRLTVASRPGNGTTVEFTVELAGEAERGKT